MNASPVAGAAPSHPWRTALRWFFGAMAICVIAAAVVVYNTITLTRDAAALRHELLGVIGTPASTRIQITAGSGLLGTARLVTGFISSVPREARLALRAVHQASVGVYEFPRQPSAANRARMLRAADERMRRRGWSRIVGVNDGNTLVLVFSPTDADSDTTQEVCVAVCEGDRLVVVAGVVDAEPIKDLIAEKARLVRL